MTSDTSRARHPIRTPSACDGGVRWFLLFIAGHGGPCDRPSAVDGAVRAKRPKGRAPPPACARNGAVACIPSRHALAFHYCACDCIVGGAVRRSSRRS